MMAAAQAPQQPPLRTPSSACVTASPPLCAVRVTLDDVLLGPGPSLQILRRRLPALVRSLRWYYGPVRLLGGVRVGRAAGAFPHRPAAGRQSVAEVSRFSRREFAGVHGFPRPRRAGAPLAKTRHAIWPSPFAHRVGARNSGFRGSIAGPPAPLSTLRPRRHRRRRMTRGQRGSLLLHCGVLSSPTPRRFIPALSRKLSACCVETPLDAWTTPTAIQDRLSTTRTAQPLNGSIAQRSYGLIR